MLYFETGSLVDFSETKFQFFVVRVVQVIL